MEHTKDGKTYAEVEPEVEYFVRIEVEPGPCVVARIDVDGKYLGYNLENGVTKQEEKQWKWVVRVRLMVSVLHIELYRVCQGQGFRFD